MNIWSSEIKELEKLYESFKDHLPELEKELVKLIKADDENMILLYSRRSLEVIITDLCEFELKRDRGTEPLKGIIDKLNKEKKVPAHIASSMYGLNELSTYGTHPKDFEPEQVKPVLNNLYTILKWYGKYKDIKAIPELKHEEEKYESSKVEVTPTGKSIAVLPFVDMSPEKDQDYFCEGMAEEIIDSLAHIENLKVIARTSAFAFKGRQTDIREIGKVLNVETILEGSIRKSGDRIRITAQLIKAADGSHIWSERFDRYMKDVFDIQDEISEAISGNLKFKLLDETKSKITKRHSENLEAYNLYLKGTYSYQMLTPEGLKKAVEYFEQALLSDSKFALAYVGLGYVKWLDTIWGKIPPNEAYPRATEYVNKAMEIDSNLAEIYSVLGNVNTFYNWNWKEAERNFKKALQINSNSSMIHVNYSALLSFMRRHEEAISEAKKGQSLDPLSGYINTRTGEAYAYAGQYDKAIDEYLSALSLNPNYYLAYAQLGNAYRVKGMIREAICEKEKAVEHSGGNPFIMASLISDYFQNADTEIAERLFNSLKKRLKTEYIPSSALFNIYRAVGKDDLALKWLKKACIEHDTFLPWLLGTPVIPIGSKYMSLTKKMGLDY